jgi:hypothetical protein
MYSSRREKPLVDVKLILRKQEHMYYANTTNKKYCR